MKVTTGKIVMWSLFSVCMTGILCVILAFFQCRQYNDIIIGIHIIVGFAILVIHDIKVNYEY